MCVPSRSECIKRNFLFRRSLFSSYSYCFYVNFELHFECSFINFERRASGREWRWMSDRNLIYMWQWQTKTWGWVRWRINPLITKQKFWVHPKVQNYEHKLEFVDSMWWRLFGMQTKGERHCIKVLSKRYQKVPKGIKRY